MNPLPRTRSRSRSDRNAVFPAFVRRLPRAAVGLRGVRAWLLQGCAQQVLFMEFSRPVEVPEHAHSAQWGLVLAGRMELTIGGRRRIYRGGDHYAIGAGVPHSARISAGYSDVTVFAEPARYAAGRPVRATKRRAG